MANKKYTHFLLKGNVYANSFPEPKNSLSEAKEFIKKSLGVNRLPNNTEIW